MNDKNSTPDQTPENHAGGTQPAPPSAPDAPTVPVEPLAAHETASPASAAAQPAPVAPATETKPRRKRALLIGGGIAAAVILAGGGVAVGAAIGDEFGDDDDRPSVSDGPRQDDDRGGQDDDRGGQPGDRDDDDRQGGPQGGPVTGIGTDSADEIIAIADAAREAAEGDVTSIDAKRDGTWEVQLTTAAGAESEVRVDADLAATVISTESDDDSAPALTLDDDTIRSLVAAALAEADGMITDLDVDDDASSPYDASVLTSDNRSIDIDFSADFAVVGTDD